MRVLLVDDNPEIVKVLAVRLMLKGYECLTALNGHEAMCLMADPGIDALVTDLDMPYIHGSGLINIARTFKPCRSVVITGSPESAMQIYKEFPGTPVLLKPFNPEHVITALESEASAGRQAFNDAA